MRLPLLLGLAGSAATSIASPALVGGDVRWWYRPGAGHTLSEVLLYGGMAALVLAWLWLGRRLAGRQVTARRLWLIAAAWTLPLLLGPPLFSHDAYSYLAQGTLVHLGLDPYSQTPVVLAHLGHTRALDAVSPFWRHSTAPYGPLFLAVMGLVAGATGSNLVLGVIVIRLLELVGLVLLAIWLPRLAARVDAGEAPRVTDHAPRVADQAPRVADLPASRVQAPAASAPQSANARRPGALWLVLLNPLVLLQVVAPAHNDLLMAGLMVTGLALALEGRWMQGIVICSLAATIKLPALAGVAFVAVAHARRPGNASGGILVLARAAVATAATIVLVSVVSGLGLAWLTGSVFSTPARVHLAITPSTAAGWTLASALHATGIKVSTSGVESALSAVSAALVGLFLLALLKKTRIENLLPLLGCALLIVAFGGPAAWPWYFVWGVAVLSAWPLGRWAAPLAAGCVAGSFAVKPDGILALPVQAAPAVLCAYLGLAAVAWYGWRRTGLVSFADRRSRPAGLIERRGLAGIR